MDEKITAIILSGGKSRRMGQNKAMLSFKGKRLIDHAIGIIQPLASSILISSNQPIPEIEYPVVADELKEKGPLAGLHACLKKSTTRFNMVIPCDAPFVTTNLYKQLINKAEGFHAVVPVLPDGKMEPLIAIYSKNSLPFIEEQLRNDDLKVINLFEKIKVNYIKISDNELFRNLNTPQDLWE